MEKSFLEIAWCPPDFSGRISRFFDSYFAWIGNQDEAATFRNTYFICQSPNFSVFSCFCMLYVLKWKRSCLARSFLRGMRRFYRGDQPRGR